MNAANKDGSGGAVSVEMRSLLERRSTLQVWLANLDDLGSRYRPEIADRVRTDYQARLAEVVAELEDHRGAIESSLADCRMARQEVDVRFEAKSAEIEEIELRFQIGEFDEPTWAGRRDEYTSILENIKAEQEIAVVAVLEMETVLAELDGANGEGKVSAPRSKPAQKPEPVPEMAPAEQSEPAVEQSEPPVEPLSEPGIALVPDAEAETTEDSEPSADEEPDSDFLDELEFLESLSLDDTDSFDAVSRMLEDEETAGDGSSGGSDS